MSKWSSILGSWERFLTPILENELVSKDLDVIRSYYLGSSITVYPRAKDIFKVFRECPYNKLSVVIILQDPYHDGSATGIAMGNDSSVYKMSPTLRIVEDTIARTVYTYREFNFDPSLISWCHQGVLMLNTALTVEKGKPLSHKHLWNNFTKQFLIKLSNFNSGIVYCLWGKSAIEYEKYINPKLNYILKDNHPMYSLYQNKLWECNHFNKVNEILKKNNNLYIKW